MDTIEYTGTLCEPSLELKLLDAIWFDLILPIRAQPILSRDRAP